MNDYLLPESRLKPYRQIQGVKERDLISVYFLLQDISSKLFIPLQSLEIVLRNKIDESLKKQFSRDDWYDDKTFYMTDLSRKALGSTRTLIERNIKNRRPNSDDFVANLTFGFWVAMHHEQYKNNDQNNFWDSNFEYVYKDFKHRKKVDLDSKLNNVYNNLVVVNDTRNRLYHYESIWKSNNGKNFKSAINVIEEKYKTILRVLRHLDGDLEKQIIELKACKELQRVFDGNTQGASHLELVNC